MTATAAPAPSAITNQATSCPADPARVAPTADTASWIAKIPTATTIATRPGDR